MPKGYRSEMRRVKELDTLATEAQQPITGGEFELGCSLLVRFFVFFLGFFFFLFFSSML